MDEVERLLLAYNLLERNRMQAVDTFSDIVNIESFLPDEWLDESARLSKQYDHILIQEIARKSRKLERLFRSEELFVVSSLK